MSKQQDIHPNFIWDAIKSGYFVQDSYELMPSYLTNDLFWTCRWDFRGIWSTYIKAMKAYQEWITKNKENNE